MAGRPAIVTGATSLVGDFLVPRLLAAGTPVTALSRRPAPAAPPAGLTWQIADIGDPSLRVPAGAVLFHLAPLWLLPPLLGRLAASGVRRVVALGSTSRFTKARSGSPRERQVAADLSAAEAALHASSGLDWTVLRPTLIYGRERDRNVSSLARLVRRFGFLPLAGDALGLRQPVHAEDVALACLAVVDTPATFGRAYDLGGGTTLTYRAMAETICRGLGRRPRLLRLPRRGLRALLRVGRHLPGLGHLTPEMADRMSEDLCFDWSEARRDFGYAPRRFGYPDGAPAEDA